MHKLFNLNFESESHEVVERLRKNNNYEDSTKGLYDLNVKDGDVSGFFWYREEVVVLNEADIHSSAQTITFFKVSRFLFRLRHVSKRNYLLQIESSSKSIKPFLKALNEITQSKLFVSQIDVDLEKFSNKIISLNLPLTTITHAYASSQVISASDKITFYLYSSKNAIESSQELLGKKKIRFDRIKLQSSESGRTVVLDIRSNCLYNVSEANSEIEKRFIDYVISTQYES